VWCTFILINSMDSFLEANDSSVVQEVIFFIDSEDTLPCSQDPATWPYYEPFKSSPHSQKICNNTRPYTPVFPTWPSSFTFSQCNFVYIYIDPMCATTSFHLIFLVLFILCQKVCMGT
jgi:hypothetical protein